MKRALLISISLFAIVLLAGLGGGYWLLNSADALQRLIAFGAGYLPGTLTVEGVEGRLRGPLAIRGLEYRDGRRHVRLAHLALAWRPGALWGGTLHIRSLEMRGLEVRTSGSSDRGAAGFRMPLKVLVERLEAESLTFQGEEGPPQRIERAALRARLEEEVLRVDTLAVRADLGELDARGRVDLASPLRADLETVWRLRVPGQPELQGQGRVRGSAERIDVRQVLEQPARATLEGWVAKPLETSRRWSARFKAERIDLTPWLANPPGPLREIDLRLTGDSERFEGEGAFTSILPGLGPSGVQVQIAGDRRELRFSRLRLAPDASALRLYAEGRVDLDTQPPGVTVSGRWEAAQWPLSGAAQVVSPGGSFEWRGTPDDYRWQVAAPVELPRIPLGEWRFQGRGDRQGLQIQSLTGRLADGEVTGSGEVVWAGGLSWAAHLQGSRLDPAAFLAGWPGQLAFEGKARGRLDEAEKVAQIELAEVTGRVREHPVQGGARLEIANGVIRIRQAELRSGTSRIALEGRLGQGWDLGIRLKVGAVDQWLPAAGGRIEAEGRLMGPVAEPRLKGRFQLSDFHYWATRVAASEGRVEADLASGGRVEATLSATGVQAAGSEWGEVMAMATGRVGDHRLKLSMAGQAGRFDLTLRGGYGDGRWRGAAERGAWETPSLGTWRLAERVPIEAGRERVAVGRHCWQGEVGRPQPARLCAEGDWRQAAGWRVAGETTRLPLDWVHRWLPDGASVAGAVSGHYTMTQDARGAVSGEARLTFEPGLIHPGSVATEAGTVAYRGGEVGLRLRDQRLTASLSLGVESGGELSGQAALQPFDPFDPLAERAELSGQLRLHFPDLGLAAALLPRIGFGPGTMDLRVGLGGRLGAPALSGTLSATAQQVEIGGAGLRLREVRVTGRSEDGRRWRLTAGAASGEGRIVVEGEAELDPDRGWPARFTVKGEKFEAVNLRDYWALVSPDLMISLEKDRITVEGEVRVPEATIRPRRGGSEAVPVSRDAVIVGEETVEANPLLRAFHARVRLVLGDKVEFAGFGLRARITGDVEIEDRPGSVVKGNGELRVAKGEYESYGQNLEVESGRLIFAGGPIDNPGIDARAVRRSGDVTAGILLRGTLRNPQVTLFSTPALPQADILSYLVLGVPVSEADGQSGGGSLLATAAALGYVAESPLVRQIRRGLGIEELRIESDPAKEGLSLVLGRYLSPRLYISYSMGVGETESVFRMRYKLGRNWTLETESGAESGGDLRYVIER
ncbi:MAG: translocation/assembly module TamB domain-containing protein [Gammaproteobacteria bacterium]